MHKRRLLLLSLTMAASAALAELKLPALFSDGMVLQRDQPVAIWGWADAGSEVTVSFAGQEQVTRSDADGKFMVRLRKMEANANPQVLSVKTGKESVEAGNVLVGDVWLCSGQSNMFWPISRSKDPEKERESADYPQIRMFLLERTDTWPPAGE